MGVKGEEGHMIKKIIVLLLILLVQNSVAEDDVIVMNPNDIQLSPYVHDSLSKELLTRIKSTTDVFEIVDGITYEQAVDLYRRDVNPEENIVIWEEMARVYKLFCVNRCTIEEERMDVYSSLLLRSMFKISEALARLQKSVITNDEAKSIMTLYKLEAQPIAVIKE